MLAIKAAISRKEDKTSIVFDEVDTGVSGRVAQAIAQRFINWATWASSRYFTLTSSHCHR